MLFLNFLKVLEKCNIRNKKDCMEIAVFIINLINMYKLVITWYNINNLKKYKKIKLSILSSAPTLNKKCIEYPKRDDTQKHLRTYLYNLIYLIISDF